MLKKAMSIMLTVALVSTIFVGCSSSNKATTGTQTKSTETKTTEASGSKKFKIVVMPKLVGIPYFNASEEGAKKAGQDLGVEVTYTGPTKADAAEQVKMIEDLISKGVDAIAVAPNDAAALKPVLKKAKDKGILVMDWDTPADKDLVALSVHQIDDKEYGQHLWDEMVKKMGTDSGEYAILTGGLSAANLNGWIEAGSSYAKTKYPNLKLVTDKVPTDEKQQVAYQKTLELIKAYPNLKGIVAVSTPAPLGAAQAVQEKGLQDKIAVVGSALPNDSKKYLSDGSLDTAVLWDPGKLGYLTVALAKMKLEDKEIKDGMDIPNVGKIKVESDGKTIIMGAPSDFTKDNVDQFNF
ncbi:autoinducer 2 ABC transporter substrate-binding protein [Clostridium sp. SYSU_GA19001]|uniref:autoinducer 2 ABC transporter substrate-binding protein n=1 Tax=Clostridium caldaquaticum TaxID=2940653 RepID=UPI00207796B4|nr:autoinducer 2 ABC transporter substrate-binding protein [Clostridium caldaquaticum]MCM8710012.1 autoinducer 2 ABC transporter substrate-binding protein [Clostridium caldaquaticum]